MASPGSWRMAIVAAMAIALMSGSPVCFGAQTQAKTQAAKSLSLGEAAEKAIQQSQLTLPGSAAFHLKATMADVNGTHPEYKADLEEYWVSPTKWRRTIPIPRNFHKP